MQRDRKSSLFLLLYRNTNHYSCFLCLKNIYFPCYENLFCSKNGSDSKSVFLLLSSVSCWDSSMQRDRKSSLVFLLCPIKSSVPQPVSGVTNISDLFSTKKTPRPPHEMPRTHRCFWGDLRWIFNV